MSASTNTARPTLTYVRGRRPHDPWVLGAALVPLMALLVGVAYVVRARLAIGEWPAPYRPDPKDLGFELHHLLWILAINAALLSPIWTLGVLILRRVQHGSRYRHLASVALGATVWALALGLLLTDPGSFVEWTFD